MAEKEIILKEKIKFVGYGDFKGVYSYAYDWFKAESYTVVEEEYTEKIKGSAKEIVIQWKTNKKITDYFKSEIDLKWKILNMEDVEVEIDGKKKKMNKFGELAIELKGTLVKDYEGKWDVSATTKFFKEIYNKYVIPSRNKQMKDRIEKDLQDFKEEMKAYLELLGKRNIPY